jgi:hypothetical protein
MNNETTASADLRPVVPVPDEVGDEEFDELKKMLKLEAALDLAVEARTTTTYKAVATASGWYWRDAKFQVALGRVSEKSIARGGGAKSAVVCRAGNDGRPARPGRPFYEMVERARQITIPKLPNGEYHTDDAEKVWISEMIRLGFPAATLAATKGEGSEAGGPLERFVERPLAVAASLDRGACGGSYTEACILISGVVSAVASFVWPGERIDRKRFVEAWVRFGAPTTPKVSIPLLRLSLLADRRPDEAQKLAQMRNQMFGPGYDARVLTGDEVDADESEIQNACPTLDREMLRRHSYAVLFYEQVRSKLVHEYELDGSATAFPMTTRKAGVSYANRMRLPGVTHDKVHHVRRIHFHVDWLVELARTIARNADSALVAGKVERPEPWWLDDVCPEETARALAAIETFLAGKRTGATAEEIRAALKIGKHVLAQALRHGCKVEKLKDQAIYTVA